MDEVVICVECEAMQNLGAGLNKQEDKKEELSIHFPVVFSANYFK